MKATDQDAREVEMLRRLGSAGRLNVAFGLFEFTRERLLAHFRHKYPDWTDQQVRAATRERLMAIR